MSWFTKMIGVDRVVENKINQAMLNMNAPNSIMNPQLLEYRQREYKTWASSNANNLLIFYKSVQEPTLTETNRLMFWEWVGGINVPKVHYPAPEILLNYIKGILFSGDVEISISNEDEKVQQEYNDRIDRAKKDINFDEFTSNGSLFETYSGSLAAKFVIDKEVHDKPIIQLYPAERFELRTKYGKTVEITFLDEYWKGTKVYTLRSRYGKGYIRYELWYENKQVKLSTLEETKDLEDIMFNKDVMLATWKKNKTVSNEFSELPYGGSDFEGITDIFHSIDEIFSTLVLYIRRNRPVMGVDESLLPVNKDGSATVTPKEYQFDMLKFRNNDSNKDKIYRDNPEIKTDAYMTSIAELMMSAYQKVGMSHATVNDSGIGANASGDSITKREKSTMIMRDSKIKLWIPFIENVMRLYFVCEDYMKNNIITRLYDDLEWSITFADYNGQTFAEKVEELSKAKASGLIDTATAIDKLYRNDLTEEERKELVKNAKLEAGVPLFESEV